MSKQAYIIPKGVDEREVPFPSSFTEEQAEEMKRNGIKCINWNGLTMLVGPGYNPSFFNELAKRRRANQSIIIVITGAPGEDKTYCGLRIGEIFDKKFDMNVNVAFTRTAISGNAIRTIINANDTSAFLLFMIFLLHPPIQNNQQYYSVFLLIALLEKCSTGS